MRVVATLGTVVCAIVGLSGTARGQSSPPPAPSLYTAAQATRGESVYRKVCVECHETLEYTGAEFRAKWNGRPAFELFDLIATTMPEETPGSLPAQEYADVMAYMLKLNAVPPGNSPLPTNADSLKKIKIAIPAPGKARSRE